MEPTALVPATRLRRLRRAEVLHVAGLLAVAWYAGPWVVRFVEQGQRLLEQCGTGFVADPAVACSSQRAVVALVAVGVAVLPIVVFGAGARRPYLAGDPLAVLAALSVSWLAGIAAYYAFAMWTIMIFT